jgi:hypothetical protein
MAAMKKKAIMEDPWAKPSKSKPAKPVKVIKTVPKKVVEAKPKVNPNAPKPVKAATPGLKIIPGGSKPKTMTKTEKEKKRLTAPRRIGGRAGGGGGMIGGRPGTANR